MCGTVRGGGGEPRGHETVPGEGGAYWSLCVPMGRARSGLPQEPLWGRLGPEICMKTSDFTDLRILGGGDEIGGGGDTEHRIKLPPA